MLFLERPPTEPSSSRIYTSYTYTPRNNHDSFASNYNSNYILIVTTSKALVTTSKALVSNRFLLLLVRHLLLVAMHLFLVASYPPRKLWHRPNSPGPDERLETCRRCRKPNGGLIVDSWIGIRPNSVKTSHNKACSGGQELAAKP